MARGRFSKLFEPIEIGKISLRNRLLMSPMATCFARADHFVTEQLIGYYARRAEGGVGLIVVEATCIDDPLGVALPHQLCIDGDKYIPGLSKLTETVHSHGARIALQLHHAGPESYLDEDQQPIGPSPLPSRDGRLIRELHPEEIREIVKKYALGAKRAREAGFDGVEIQCAHGYLLNHFLSPHVNRRQDGYGGSFKGRMRIIQEIIESVKTVTGDDFPILVKVPGDDYVDGGIILEEGIAICSYLEDLGVCAVTITGGGYPEARFHHICPMGYPEGWQVPMAEKLKQRVRIPVAAMGKIKHPGFMEKILGDGKAEMVAIGRALIADPDLVVKSQRNEIDRIIPCISCNHCLDRIADQAKTLRCSVNPLVGREYDTRISPAARPRKVVVVGGGPAGMETAIVAASRGHEVVLFEKTEKLGGQLLLAAIPPDRDEIAPFVDYLSGQIKEMGVDVRLDTKGACEVVAKMNPEVVISATGASPRVPPIPGARLNNAVTAWDALLHPEKVENNVVVVGGGLVGCEVARFLAEQGKAVTIVEQLEDLGSEIITVWSRTYELRKLREAGVTIMTKTLVREITKEGVVLDDNGKPKTLPADTVVLAVGARSDRELVEALSTGKMEVYAVGDCVAPRKIVEATSQGFHVGCWI